MKNDIVFRAAAVFAAVLMSVTFLSACAETHDIYVSDPYQDQQNFQTAEDNENNSENHDMETDKDVTSEDKVNDVADEIINGQMEELTAHLHDIRENVWIGTAGSSLRAAQEAVKLMNWAVNTPLDNQQISACIVNFTADLDEAEKEEFDMQLQEIDATYRLLLQGKQVELLEDAGISASDIPFGSDSIEAMESVMKAAGLR